MFDDFRKQIDDSSFFDAEKVEEARVEMFGEEHHFLGMTPFQRFIVAVMILLMTIILGVLFLLVTSRIALPVFSG
jgi:hypothetical protein